MTVLPLSVAVTTQWLKPSVSSAAGSMKRLSRNSAKPLIGGRAEREESGASAPLSQLPLASVSDPGMRAAASPHPHSPSSIG